MTIVLYCIAIITFLFIFVDIFIHFAEWQSRIHIGKWENRKSWQEAIEKKAESWLWRTPIVRATNQNRLMLLDILRGKFSNTTVQTWQIAGLLLGVHKRSAEDYVKSKSIVFTQKDLLPEDFLLAYALKKQGLLKKDQENNILGSIKEIKNAGTIYYRPWVKNIRFVDTLGMVLPFLNACGWDDLAKRQIEEFDQALLYGIFPAHAYDVEKKLSLGVHDWSRGIGWYILGLTEAQDLKGNNDRIVRLATALLPLQLDGGGFSSFVFNKRERMESSGTALIGLLFICAYQLSNDKKFLYAAIQAEQALMKATRRNGAIDYCQGDTPGIGYYSNNFSIMPFTQGMALMLSKKLDKLLDENY